MVPQIGINFDFNMNQTVERYLIPDYMHHRTVIYDVTTHHNVYSSNIKQCALNFTF